MKKGFTLAEVLITLVIIGVIAAMTIPTLMNSTNAQEYRTGIKKAISALNQAITLNYALDGTYAYQASSETAAPGSEIDATAVINNVFVKRMSVLSTEKAADSPDFGVAGTNFTTSPASGKLFYTADGMRYGLMSAGANKIGKVSSDGEGEYYYGYFLIDVNGDKGPNRANADTTNYKDITDTFEATMFANRVVAGGPNFDGSADTNCQKVTRAVMFEKKAKKLTAN